MGNYITYRPSDHAAAGKVILSDGKVHEFDKPLTVAELMLEHPQQVVVELLRPSVSEKRPSPLPADMKLDIKKVYVMLPMRRVFVSEFLPPPENLSRQVSRKGWKPSLDTIKEKKVEKKVPHSHWLFHKGFICI